MLRSPLHGLFKAQGGNGGGGEGAENGAGRCTDGTDEYGDGYHNENDGGSEVGGPSVQPGKPSVQRGLFTQSTQGQGQGQGLGQGQGGHGSPLILGERPNEAAPSAAHRTGKAPARGAAFDPLKVSRRRAQGAHHSPVMGGAMVLDYQDPSGPQHYTSGKRGGTGSSPFGKVEGGPSALAVLEAQGLMGPGPSQGVPTDSSDTHSLVLTSSVNSEGPFKRGKRGTAFGRRAGGGGGGHAMWGRGGVGTGAGESQASQAFADSSSVSSGALAVGLGPTQSTTSNGSRMSDTHRWLADAGKALGWSPSLSQSQSHSQARSQSRSRSQHGPDQEPGTPPSHHSLRRGYPGEGIPEEGYATPPGSTSQGASASYLARRPRTAPPKKQWGTPEGPGPVGSTYDAGAGSVLGSPGSEAQQRSAWRAKWAKRGSPLASSLPQLPRGVSAAGYTHGTWGPSETEESEAEREGGGVQAHTRAYRQGAAGYKGGQALSHSPSSRARRVEWLLKARGSRQNADGAPRRWKGRGAAADAPPHAPSLMHAAGAANSSATHARLGRLGRGWAQQGEQGAHMQAAIGKHHGPLPGTSEGGGGWGSALAPPGLGLSAAYQRRDAGYLGSGDEEGMIGRGVGTRLMAPARLSPAIVVQAAGGLGGLPLREAGARSLVQARQLAVLQQARERERAAALGSGGEDPSAAPGAPGTPPPGTPSPDDQGQEGSLRASPPLAGTGEHPLTRASLGLDSPSAGLREPTGGAFGSEGDRGDSSCDPSGYSSEASSHNRGSHQGRRAPALALPRPATAASGYAEGTLGASRGARRQDLAASWGGADSMMRLGSVSSAKRGAGLVASLSVSSNASVALGPLKGAGGVPGVPRVGTLPPGYRLFEAPSLEGLRGDAREAGKGGGRGSRFRIRRVLSLGHGSTREDEASERLMRHRQSTMLRQQLLLKGLQVGREELALQRSLSALMPSFRLVGGEEGEGQGGGSERVGELVGGAFDRRRARGARPATAAFRGEEELRRWRAVAGGEPEGSDLGAESEPEGGESTREKRERRVRSKVGRAQGLGLSRKGSLSVAPQIKRAVTLSVNGSMHAPRAEHHLPLRHDAGLTALPEHPQGHALAALGMGKGRAVSGDLIKQPLFHAPLPGKRSLAPEVAQGLGLRHRSFSTAGASVSGRNQLGASAAEGVVVAGLVSFWLGFCVAALVGELERKRLETELAQERESAAFLAHVTALEWNRKQEAEREKVLAARDSGLELWKRTSASTSASASASASTSASASASTSTSASASTSTSASTSASASTSTGAGGRARQGSAGAPGDPEGPPLAGPSSSLSALEKLTLRSPTAAAGLPALGLSSEAGCSNSGSGTRGEGDESEGAAASGKALEVSAPGQGEGALKRPSVLQGGEEEGKGGVAGDAPVGKEVQEYVQGLEKELEGAYSDLDMALAELDGTKGELDEVLAELEACRADLEGLDMTRHKVKTLRVCLEILRQSERKAVGQAEGMKRELRKAEALLVHSSREMRKLRQENTSMRTALGALFLNLTMAVRATPPHNSHPSPSPSPKGPQPRSSSAEPLVRPPSPLPPLRRGAPPPNTLRID